MTFDDYRQHRELLKKCAATALSSKLVAHQKQFFASMVVDAVMMLDELLPLNMIGVKKIQGGALEVRVLEEEPSLFNVLFSFTVQYSVLQCIVAVGWVTKTTCKKLLVRYWCGYLSGMRSK